MFGSSPPVTNKTNVKFKDVAGMREAKQEVMEFVDFLRVRFANTSIFNEFTIQKVLLTSCKKNQVN